MAYTLTSFIGIGAGLLIMAVGGFVVVARSEGWLARLFFLLAILDGVSTILFEMSASTLGAQSAFYQALYWYAYIAFIALLAGFGILFPLPWRSGRTASVLVASIGIASMAALVTHALHHDWFWIGRERADGAVTYVMSPLGNVVNGVFSLAVGAIALKLAGDVTASRSDSHRRQAAFVLGGIALAYAPYPVGTLARVLARRPDVLFAARADRIFAYWAFVAVCAALVVSLALLLRDARLRGRVERAFLLATYATVGGMAVIVWLTPTLALSQLLRSGALLAYPLLLAWAIARYEIFDIDKQLRRAATVTFVAVALTAAFVLAESALENVLASSVFGGLSSRVLSGILAALATAALFVPIARSSRKAASKLVPELSEDEISRRKREIYAHSLAGALADGILREGESRTLTMLRQSLGISDAEHKAILAEVVAA